MSEEEKRERKVARITGPAENGEQDTDWGTIYEQQMESPSKPHPFLDNIFAKVGCGCLMPLLFLFSALGAASSYDGGGSAYLMGYLAASVAVGAAFIWLPLFLFWLRGQSAWLIIGSLVAILVFLLIINVVKTGTVIGQSKNDAAGISDIQMDKDGRPILPNNLENAGPMSKMVAEMAKKQTAVDADYQADLARLQTENFGDPRKLAANPEILSRCDEFAETKSKIETYRNRSKQNLTDMEKQIETMDVGSEYRKGIQTGFQESMKTGLPRIDIQWDTQKAAMVAMYEVCSVLKKRQWKAAGDVFQFASNADMQAYQTGIDEINRQDAIFQKNKAEGVRRFEASRGKLRDIIN